jgi:hypothetical protein
LRPGRHAQRKIPDPGAPRRGRVRRSRLIDPRNPAIAPTSRHRARGGRLARGVIPPRHTWLLAQPDTAPSPLSPTNGWSV